MLSLLHYVKPDFFSGALRAQNHISSKTLYVFPLACQSQRKDWNWIMEAGTISSHHHQAWNDWQREDQGISITPLGDLDQNRGGGVNNNSPVPTFGNRFSSEMVFGDPKPDLFSRWRGDKREVSRMDIPWCKNNRQIDREPPPPPRVPPPPPLPRDRSSRKYRSRGD